ncbi:hypothetical protein BGY98DRAFT_1099952 [Russula aff. rugulosa BPL654]|nr:hypothetical protein BGY98DRAFT_1099952 [Russula aff. rugulosa BPL654]
MSSYPYIGNPIRTACPEAARSATVPAVIHHSRLLVSKAVIGSPTTPVLQQHRHQVTRTPTAGIPEGPLMRRSNNASPHVLSTVRPWKWHHLAHVCRTWRHVISMSLRNLDLRILCEYRTYREYFGYLANIAPSRKVIFKSGIKTPTKKHYGCNPSPRSRFGDSPCDKLDDWTNHRNDAETVSELESIRIRVQDTDVMGPSRVAHNAFLGDSAPRLREIGLHRVALPFPEIRQVLSSTNNLVDLRLSNIPNSIYFTR